MNNSSENDILFDDFSILNSLIGSHTLAGISANSDCDCTGYTSTPEQDEFDTIQITSSFGEAN